MSWKLAAGFAVPWALMAILAAVMALAATPEAGSSGAAAEAFVNLALNPQEVSVDQPTLGTSSNPLGGVWQMVMNAIGWLVEMANAASLNYAFFEGRLLIVKYVMLAFAAPFMLKIARESAALFTNMIGGIFGRVSSPF